MQPVLWLALAAAFPLPLYAAAPAANPADPSAPVPRMAYRSVIPPSPWAAASAPADWKRSNAEVGQFLRGHMDLLQWEAKREQPAAAPSGAAPASPARPAAAGHQH